MQSFLGHGWLQIFETQKIKPWMREDYHTELILKDGMANIKLAGSGLNMYTDRPIIFSFECNGWHCNNWNNWGYPMGPLFCCCFGEMGSWPSRQLGGTCQSSMKTWVRLSRAHIKKGLKQASVILAFSQPGGGGMLTGCAQAISSVLPTQGSFACRFSCPCLLQLQP